MINFTVGPVQMSEQIMNMGANPVPYFRTNEFSELMKQNEQLIKKFFYAPENSRAVFLTGSGTAAMEASVMNIFNDKDKVLVVNGGGFGKRFAQICEIHNISYEEIKLDYFQQITEEKLSEYNNKGFTGLLVNVHETTTGVLYDMELISDFCRKNNILLVADAISSFIADEFYMEKWNVGAVITGSQKALALPPGVSVVVMNNEVVERIYKNKVQSMYFDLEDCLKNGERGQTPFTPAVGILIQLNQRLTEMNKNGIDYEHNKVKAIAEDFRKKIRSLPYEIMSDSLSYAITPIKSKSGISAKKIFEILKDNYNIWVCPNGGDLSDIIFRVGHIGNLTIEENDALIHALKEIGEETNE